MSKCEGYRGGSNGLFIAEDHGFGARERRDETLGEGTDGADGTVGAWCWTRRANGDGAAVRMIAGERVLSSWSAASTTSATSTTTVRCTHRLGVVERGKSRRPYILTRLWRRRQLLVQFVRGGSRGVGKRHVATVTHTAQANNLGTQPSKVIIIIIIIIVFVVVCCGIIF